METIAISSAIPKPISTSRRLTRAEKRRTHALREEYAQVLDSLNSAQNDLTAALINFDNAAGKAIDVWIYRIQSAQSQYDNLLKQLQVLSQKIKYPDCISV